MVGGIRKWTKFPHVAHLIETRCMCLGLSSCHVQIETRGQGCKCAKIFMNDTCLSKHMRGSSPSYSGTSFPQQDGRCVFGFSVKFAVNARLDGTMGRW